IRILNGYYYLIPLLYQPLSIIRLIIKEEKIKSKERTFWLRQTEIHLPPIVGLAPFTRLRKENSFGNVVKT
ncbi:hypothetical protein ACIGHG_24925, partial [Bacillus sp. NPDC077411]|uniref:hypothetical protein n=1 Tax=Bacillus sp. NPDC077411 TaxID=3363947 RepID=UPI0037CC34D7